MAKKTLKAADIETLENTSMATLLGADAPTTPTWPTAVNTTCCQDSVLPPGICSVGTICSITQTCCTGFTCVAGTLA